MTHLVDLVAYTPPPFSLKGGYNPPPFSLKGGLCRFLLRRGPVSPSAVPRKHQIKVCVLGMGCGCPASASKLNFGRLGQARGRSATVFSLYPQLTEKPEGIPPFDHFPYIEVCWLPFMPPSQL